MRVIELNAEYDARFEAAIEHDTQTIQLDPQDSGSYAGRGHAKFPLSYAPLE